MEIYQGGYSFEKRIPSTDSGVVKLCEVIMQGL
jgi:hypothetical protein